VLILDNIPGVFVPHLKKRKIEETNDDKAKKLLYKDLRKKQENSNGGENIKEVIDGLWKFLPEEQKTSYLQKANADETTINRDNNNNTHRDKIDEKESILVDEWIDDSISLTSVNKEKQKSKRNKHKEKNENGDETKKERRHKKEQKLKKELKRAKQQKHKKRET